MAAQIGGNAATGRAADPGANRLDSDHQGPSYQQRPAEGEAELGAGLRVSGDPAGIIVGSAGDETGPQSLQQVFTFHDSRIERGRPRSRSLPWANVVA